MIFLYHISDVHKACEAYGRDAENADVRRKAFLAARRRGPSVHRAIGPSRSDQLGIHVASHVAIHGSRLGSGNLPVIAEMLRIRQAMR